MPTPYGLVLRLCLLALVPITGCKSRADGKSRPSAAPSGPTTLASASGQTEQPPGRQVCRVRVTGARTQDWTGLWQGPHKSEVTAASDYWMSDEQMRTSLKHLTGVMRERTPEEERREVDEAMKKDPRFSTLQMNCGDSRNSIIMMAAGKYADIPFEPRSYPITEGKDKPGVLNVMFNLDRDFYEVVGQGKLDVERFDLTGVSGSFSLRARPRFGAKTEAESIDIEGSFDYPCNGDLCKVKPPG